MTELLTAADEDYGLPKYRQYNRELCPPGEDYDDLPEHLKLMPLPEFLDYLKPGAKFVPGVYVLFDVEGYDRAELYMSIYVRTAFDYEDYFPLIKVGLRGTVIDDLPFEAKYGGFRRNPDSQEPKGTMFGKGAFRSLMAFLERELPQRGFKGIFLEQVHNEILQSVALRYGFERLTKPTNICFIKHFTV